MVFPGDKFDFTDFLKDKDVYYLSEEMLEHQYKNNKLNRHHFNTELHYDYVLSKLDEMFGFGYNRDDFYTVHMYENYEDYPILIPKTVKNFESYYYKVVSETEDDFYSELTKDDDNSITLAYSNTADKVTSMIDTNSVYHKLFKFTHMVSKVINVSENNGKTLLISCDSQIIPCLPALCYYYKKVITLDNRMAFYDLFDGFVSFENPDDMLFAIWKGNRIDDYTVFNLA